MNLGKQLCSLEQAKQLAALGVSQTAHYSYKYDELNGRYAISGLQVEALEIIRKTNRPEKPVDFYSAYSVAEMGEMLPEMITVSGLAQLCRLVRGKIAPNPCYQQ